MPSSHFGLEHVPSKADIRIIHFNDVYNICPSSHEPVGGAAKFQTVVKHYQTSPEFESQSKPLTFFSGNALNPSLESIFTRGQHMTELLNQIGVDAACIGNHELDFGVDRFEELAQECDFPWLLANVLDPSRGEGVPLGNCLKAAMLTTSNGIQVGLIGLVEKEWLPTVNQLPPNLEFRSASETARELSAKLRAAGAEVIIALTHQREPNDVRLAYEAQGAIDVILGGHDHIYKHEVISGTHILRSGSDFKQLSYLELRKAGSVELPQGGRQQKWNVQVAREDIDSRVPSDLKTAQWVREITQSIRPQLEPVVAQTAVELDARFDVVRLRESNIGNLVTDILRQYYDADCCIMAAGTVRGDCIYPPGPLTLKDIRTCFPFEDPWVVLLTKGQAIWDALEVGVSLYPAAEGRFPQVSGMDFSFDPSRVAGSRVLSASIGGSPLVKGKNYRLCTRDYMARGKDGFTPLLSTSSGGSCEELVMAQEGLRTYEVLLKYFESLDDYSRSQWGVDAMPDDPKRRGVPCSEQEEVDILDDTMSEPNTHILSPFELSATSSTTDTWSSSSSQTDMDTSTGESSISSRRKADDLSYSHSSVWGVHSKEILRFQPLTPFCEGRIRIYSNISC
ncbi:flagellar associated protein [Astrocystis sublimbata]|nr:flagellar associated protein [Astrocystis sublimbata]